MLKFTIKHGRAIGRLKKFLLASSVAVALQSPLSTYGAVFNTDELVTYRTQQMNQVFSQKLQQLPAARESTVRTLLNGIYFIDYGHAASQLMMAFLGHRTLEQLNFPYLYDQPQEAAFARFVKGMEFLAGYQGKLSLDMIRTLHQVTLGETELEQQKPGMIRQQHVYGPEFEHGLAPDQIRNVNQNSYLFFQPATSIHADVPQNMDQAQNGERLRGAIVYPRPRDIKLTTLLRLQPGYPDLVRRVLEYQRRYQNDYSNQDLALTQELISALLTERIERFEADVRKLGTLKTREAVDHYIRLIAEFQRDYISIHPFQDGNGRTSRLLLYHLSARQGLPLPRLTYPNEDILWNGEMWTSQIKSGMRASARLEQDLANRIELQIPLEKSVEFLTPVLPFGRSVGLSSTTETYSNYVRMKLQTEERVREGMRLDAVGTMRQLEREFFLPVLNCQGIFNSRP